MTKLQKYLLFIIAMISGLIIGLPTLFSIHQVKFQPDTFYTPFTNSDLDTYGAQIREVYEGKLFSGDAYNYEAKNKLPIFPWIPSLILGLLARLIGSVESVFVLGHFIFTPFLFWLMFIFVYRVTKHYWGAVSASLSALFLYHLTTKLPPINTKMFLGLVNIVILKEPFAFTFGRLPPPQLTFIFFLIFLISLYQILKFKSKLWPLVCGVCAGLLAYVYFFHWTVAVGMLIICLVLNWLSSAKAAVQRLGLALAVAVVISAPYLLQILSADLTDKQLSEGRIDGRFLEPFTTIRYGIFSVLIYLLTKKDKFRVLLLSIFLTAIGLMNIQLVTGFTMDPGHWPNSTIEPLVIISGFSLILINLKRFKLKKAASKLWLLVIAIFVYAGANQIAYARRFQQLSFMAGNERRLYDWLNQNSLPESVVLSLNKRLTRRLPALTHNNPYLPYGSLSQVSLTEIWERTNLAFSLFELGDQAILSKLGDGQFTGHLFIKTYRYTNQDDLSGLEIPAEVKAKISQTSPIFSPGVLYIPDNLKRESLEQTLMFRRASLRERLCRYRLDYILVDQADRQLMATNPFSNPIFVPVFQENDLILYQIDTDECKADETIF